MRQPFTHMLGLFTVPHRAAARRRPSVRKWIIFVAIWPFALLAAALHAADVKVRAIDRATGQVLANAAVCLGTPANLDQFGARLTSETGIAEFSNVPRTQVVFTVSKSGFMGYQSVQTLPHQSYVLTVTLTQGGLGPQCRSTGIRKTGTEGNGLAVLGMRVDMGAQTPRGSEVSLTPSVSGAPTEYRASEQSDFGDAEWRPYSEPIRFLVSPGPGPKTIYFQVRRHRETHGGSLQVQSRVLSKTFYAK